FEFDTVPAPAFWNIVWNDVLGAVIGITAEGLAAYDPRTGATIYDIRQPDVAGRRVWSAPDGRWPATWQPGRSQVSDTITVFSTLDGSRVATLTPRFGHMERMHWGPDGRLAVVSHDGDRRQLDLYQAGAATGSVLLTPRRIQGSDGLPSTGEIAWSPTGQHVAVLVDGQRIQTYDVSGAHLDTLHTPAPPIPPALPDY